MKHSEWNNAEVKKTEMKNTKVENTARTIREVEPSGMNRAAMKHLWSPALAVAALLVFATAPTAGAQASRTRPPQGHSSGGTASRSAPPPSSPSSASTPSSGGSASSSPAGHTRPGDTAGGPTTIERDARHRGGRGGRGYDVYTHRPYYPFGFGFGYGWWGAPYGWGWWGDPYNSPGYYGAPGYYGVPWYTHRVRENTGALDLDLRPGDTKIYLEGQLIGTADRFDGWPQYLWLEEGTYRFVFFREGYRTISREYRVYPGLVIDVEDQLERGESTPPEQLLAPQPTPRRDARIRRNEEQRRRVEGEERERAAGGWRQRSRAERGVESEDGEDADEGQAQGDFGSLRLTVTPADASVYLDGSFIGTGEDLARLRGGLTVEAGEHTLAIVRPGRAAEERDFEVEAGETVDLAVDLRIARSR